jgi:glycosyltransferase involved in cell wall biosynthesis
MYKKKNLIIFYPSFERGGVETILHNIVKNNKNFNLHIISSKNLLNTIKIKKKNFNFYPVTKKIEIPFIPQRFVTALNGMFVLASILNKAEKKTIVHSMQSNVAAIIVCILKRKKIIIRNSENPIYSTLNSENKLFGMLATILKLLFYNFADGIITNSKGSGESLRYFVFNKKKINPIYNPYLQRINNKTFKKKNYIINIARLRKQKDHKTLLLAFRIFLKKNKKYKLLILGHGNLENELKLLAKKLKISNKVIFKGWVENTIPFLKKSKIFVLSSVYEGLGNVLIDAINYNVPCVSTNCPSGPNEILLNGKGGYLVQTKSPKLLAEKMLYSIKNYSKSLTKNVKAKNRLNRFLIADNTKKYFDYLDNFSKR